VREMLGAPRATLLEGPDVDRVALAHQTRGGLAEHAAERSERSEREPRKCTLPGVDEHADAVHGLPQNE
jgi:hypothetical protein